MGNPLEQVAAAIVPADNVVARCIAWNMQRYNREYNQELAVRLLIEEVDELFAADQFVDVLDAVGDIAFVAIGVMWKAGVPQQVIEQFFYRHDLASLSSHGAYNLVGNICSVYLNNANEEVADLCYAGVHLAAYSCMVVALSAIRGTGMQRHFYDVVAAVCDSNDTKAVREKVAPNVKANVDKGAGFVPPTARLQQIRDLYTAEPNGRYN